MTHNAENAALQDAILALTWFPATRDAVSGQVSPPRRKTHVRVRDIDAALANASWIEQGALAHAAAWVAEATGYPIEVRMPDCPMPAALWEALVDHIHADESGKWHGNKLDRDETESWLADEAGRVLPSVDGGTDE